MPCRSLAARRAGVLSLVGEVVHVGDRGVQVHRVRLEEIVVPLLARDEEAVAVLVEVERAGRDLDAGARAPLVGVAREVAVEVEQVARDVGPNGGCGAVDHRIRDVRSRQVVGPQGGFQLVLEHVLVHGGEAPVTDELVQQQVLVRSQKRRVVGELELAQTEGRDLGSVDDVVEVWLQFGGARERLEEGGKLLGGQLAQGVFVEARGRVLAVGKGAHEVLHDIAGKPGAHLGQVGLALEVLVRVVGGDLVLGV